MDSQLEILCSHVLALLTTQPTHRLLISISGIPGSGKSTLAALLAARINNRAKNPGTAVMLPMDGFHLFRHQLDQLENPAEAHTRRGAPFTFNPEGLLEVVKKLREGVETVSAPGFDHSLKDPTENAYTIPPSVRVILLEGNYLSLSLPPWSSIAELMDERWFVEIDLDIAKERLARRHVESGICGSYEEGVRRAVENDIPNGRLVLENRVQCHRIISSLETREVEGWIEREERGEGHEGVVS